MVLKGEIYGQESKDCQSNERSMEKPYEFRWKRQKQGKDCSRGIQGDVGYFVG